jgi:hypothetical protein
MAIFWLFEIVSCLTTKSEYTRGALIEKLRAHGIDPRAFVPASSAAAPAAA